jgi:hypothetical protein
MHIINDLSRFKQQSCRPLRPYPPILKKFSILIFEICLASGDKSSPPARL